MRFIDYLKDRSEFIISNIILYIVVAGIMVFLNVGLAIIFLVFVIWFCPLSIYFILEYLKVSKFYKELIYLDENMDQKFLVTEVLAMPEFLEGKIFYDLLKSSNKAMHEKVKYYRDMQSEYRDYIEAWVHEIKTPIASSKLLIDNNQDLVTRKIGLEIKKIEEYIEQALYYSRSNDVSKDYIIKKFYLDDVIKGVIKRNSTDFISKRIRLSLDVDHFEIYSDTKWIEFIINQIITNSIKYSKADMAEIRVISKKNRNNIILFIEDNGVGISEKDINRVYDKGFTGENGRKFGKSTGIGLYLCKKLCDKLGLNINIESKEGVGTKVGIIFPIGNHTNF